MCKKLFIDDDCCLDCKMKYTPFGKSRNLSRFSREQAIEYHRGIDEMYRNPPLEIRELVKRATKKGTEKCSTDPSKDGGL